MVNIDKIYESTLISYQKAKFSIQKIEKRAIFDSAAISDTIPGYEADTLAFGSYEHDNFSVLFVDMRNSTNRAISLGPEKTFLSMHAYIPAMLEVIKHYKGVVIDLMGDGIMVFFGGKSSELTNEMAVKNSGLCGRDMITVLNKVVNPILEKDSISYKIECGVGVDFGKVIVTKIGIGEVFDVKAYGDCINKASKFSDGYNTVKVSKYIRNHWPSSENGRILFQGSDDKGYVMTSK